MQSLEVGDGVPGPSHSARELDLLHEPEHGGSNLWGWGEKVEEEETVDVEYTCGSMVWAKLKGFPPWPGMVDYCPDTQVCNIRNFNPN